MPHRPWSLIGLDLDMLRLIGTLTLLEPLAINLGDSEITLAKFSPSVKGHV